MGNEKKTIVYDYLFNYFGGDKFKDKIIVGACMQVAIKVFKDRNEVKFMNEPCCDHICLSDVFEVSFDRKDLFVIHKNAAVSEFLCSYFNWDSIEAKCVGYTLDYVVPTPENLRSLLPDSFDNIFTAESMEVTEQEFRKFLSSHLDDFDITDNINAQVPSVSFI